MMPPPWAYGPPRSSGWARAILFTLATTLFGLSLTLNVYFLVMNGIVGATSGGLTASTLQDGALNQTVAVIEIRGVLSRETFDSFDRQLRAIEDDSSVRAIVLDIDTPGGGVNASDQIYQRILRYRKDRGRPVVALMGATATSGGFYVACAADKIVAQPTSITGSIGVRLDRISLAGFGDKYGVADRSLHSTGADYKTAGSLFKEDTPEQVAYLQALIDDAFEQFKKVVATGRNLKAEEVAALANGKAYTANQALPLKLVDKIGYAADAYATAAEMASLTRPRVVRYREEPGLFDALRVEEEASMSIRSFDRETLDRLFTPRLVYLWNGH
jgi:protease IV